MDNLDQSSWQNFIYLFLILTLLLSRLFTSRELKFGVILKYLAIWGLIGMVSVSLYAYRHEFGDFKSRILGELNPSKAQINEKGEIVINISQDGHFYLEAEINQKTILFMVDTGASDIAINPKDAQKIGINLQNLKFTKAYQTANGRSWGAVVNLSEVVIANKSFYNVSASVNNADMGVSLLGMSFLRRFSKYEFYQDRLVLTL